MSVVLAGFDFSRPPPENGPMLFILFFFLLVLFPTRNFGFPPQTRPDGGGWGQTGPDVGGMGLDRTGRGVGRQTGATSAELRLLMDLVLARMASLEGLRT